MVQWYRHFFADRLFFSLGVCRVTRAGQQSENSLTVSRWMPLCPDSLPLRATMQRQRRCFAGDWYSCLRSSMLAGSGHIFRMFLQAGYLSRSVSSQVGYRRQCSVIQDSMHQQIQPLREYVRRLVSSRLKPQVIRDSSGCRLREPGCAPRSHSGSGKEAAASSIFLLHEGSTTIIVAQRLKSNNRNCFSTEPRGHCFEAKCDEMFSNM